MKKLLLVLPVFALLAGCDWFVEPEEKLPDPNPKENEVIKSVKLTKFNCGLTSDDSTEAFETSLDIEGKTEKYTFEIGPNCYNHAEYDEFLIKPNGYIKSKSSYRVDRLVIDYFSKKGVNFEVLDASNNTVAYHESSVTTEYPGENDFGAVIEYPINGTSWTIQNTTEYNKPAFYSITVIFVMAV